MKKLWRSQVLTFESRPPQPPYSPSCCRCPPVCGCRCSPPWWWWWPPSCCSTPSTETRPWLCHTASGWCSHPCWGRGQRGYPGSGLCSYDNDSWDVMDCNSVIDAWFRFLPSRLVVVSWWTFVLFLSNCYTANLAAFLTITRMETPIRSVEQLLIQPNVKLGIFYGATYEFIMVYSSRYQKCNNMW